MAQPRCITGPEAESLTLVAMPDILRETGRVCAAQLPAASLIRSQSSALIDRYQIESDRAWPAARAAIVKLSDPAVDALLDLGVCTPAADDAAGTADRRADRDARLRNDRPDGDAAPALATAQHRGHRRRDVAVPQIPEVAQR
ncbi:hypothetical protein QP164_05700 [Sphingomonas sp. LR59]|uniref:hypothetical protein n=1 Tax=Sphingomonas sp. LR59 TaxID=3050232 RepID=UPI002FE06624